MRNCIGSGIIIDLSDDLEEDLIYLGAKLATIITGLAFFQVYIAILISLITGCGYFIFVSSISWAIQSPIILLYIPFLFHLSYRLFFTVSFAKYIKCYNV